MRASFSSAVLIVVMAASSCGWFSSPWSESERVSKIGDRAVTEIQFDRFLKREVSVGREEIDEAALNQLYEDFLGELLFALEAEREGYAIDSDEIDAEQLALTQLHPELDETSVRDEARQRLLAKRYADGIEAMVEVSSEEVERELGVGDKRRRRDHVVFRQILVDEEAKAKEAYRRIVRGGEPFDVVAEEMSIAPDRGRVQQRPLANMPPATADMLKKLREGGTSRPLQVDGSYYLFQLDARNWNPDPDRSRERAEVRRRLFREKLETAKRSRIQQLAESEGLSITLAPTTGG